MGVEPDQVRTAFAIAHDCIAEAKEVTAQAQRELNMAHCVAGPGQPQAPEPATSTPTAAPVVPDIPGMNLCPDPSTERSSTEHLRMYRIWAGKPSYRVMEHQCGRRFAASTIHSALNGSNCPAWT